MSDEKFDLVVHQPERILEVRYPAALTLEAFEAYDREVRQAITALEAGGPWDCVVDQRALRALPPEFPPKIADLNAWARKHGMRRTARVLSDSAVSALQTLRILRESGVQDVGAVFHDRDAALQSLKKG